MLNSMGVPLPVNRQTFPSINITFIRDSFAVGKNVPSRIYLQLVDGKCFAYYNWPNDSAKTIYGIVLIAILFFIPFIILVFCYGRILWMLTRRINTDMTDVEVEGTKGKDNKAQLGDANRDKFQVARRNTIKTLLIVGCCFIICWTQNQVIYFMFNIGYPVDWNSAYFQFTVLMVFLNATVNPFVYLLNYKDYQIALRQLLHCNYNKRNGSNTLSSTTMSNSNQTITSST